MYTTILHTIFIQNLQHSLVLLLFFPFRTLMRLSSNETIIITLLSLLSSMSHSIQPSSYFTRNVANPLNHSPSRNILVCRSCLQIKWTASSRLTSRNDGPFSFSIRISMAEAHWRTWVREYLHNFFLFLAWSAFRPRRRYFFVLEEVLLQLHFFTDEAAFTKVRSFKVQRSETSL